MDAVAIDGLVCSLRLRVPPSCPDLGWLGGGQWRRLSGLLGIAPRRAWTLSEALGRATARGEGPLPSWIALIPSGRPATGRRSRHQAQALLWGLAWLQWEHGMDVLALCECGLGSGVAAHWGCGVGA